MCQHREHCACSVRALPSREFFKVAACDSSMSSSTQAVIPSPLASKLFRHHLTELPNLPLPATIQPPTWRICAPFQTSIRAPRPNKSAWSWTSLSCLRGSFHVASAHASGYYSGKVPYSWLEDQHLFCLPFCH